MDRCSLFYTTNYDSFVERSFSPFGGGHVVRLQSRGRWNARGDAAEIIKFHGDFDNPDVMVLTESDYEKRLVI